MISRAIGREFDWDATTSRCRTFRPGHGHRESGCWPIWETRCLLSTSNRSEAAVGYATMDGDTAGGLSPIAGIDKAFLRRWLVWMEQSGPQRIGSAAGTGWRECPGTDGRTATEQCQANRRRRPDAVRTVGSGRAIGDSRQVDAARNFRNAESRISRSHVNKQLAVWVVRFFPVVVAEPVEARTVRAIVSSG